GPASVVARGAGKTAGCLPVPPPGREPLRAPSTGRSLASRSGAGPTRPRAPRRAADREGWRRFAAWGGPCTSGPPVVHEAKRAPEPLSIPVRNCLILHGLHGAP